MDRLTPAELAQLEALASEKEVWAVLEKEINVTGYSSLASRRSPSINYKLKTLVGFLQITLAIAYALRIPWPSHFQSFITTFKFFNFDFIPWNNIQCLYKMPFFHKALVMATFPLALVTLIMLCFFLPLYFVNRNDMADENIARNRRALAVAKLMRILFFIAFLGYPWINAVLLSMYNCITINGVSYLMADFRVQCTSESHIVHALIIAPFAFFYSLGIPFCYGYYLFKHRSELRNPHMLIKAGFIYESFNDNAWYFELLEMLHKLIHTSFIPFLPNDYEMPFHMGVTIVFVVVVLLVNPHIRKGDGHLKLWSLSYIYHLALVGYILQTLGVVLLPQLENVIVSAVLIGIVSVMCIMTVLISLNNLKKICWFMHRKRKRNKMQEEVRNSVMHGSTFEALNLPKGSSPVGKYMDNHRVSTRFFINNPTLNGPISEGDEDGDCVENNRQSVANLNGSLGNAAELAEANLSQAEENAAGDLGLPEHEEGEEVQEVRLSYSRGSGNHGSVSGHSDSSDQWRDSISPLALMSEDDRKIAEGLL